MTIAGVIKEVVTIVVRLLYSCTTVVLGLLSTATLIWHMGSLQILESPRFQLNDMNRMLKSGLIIALLPTADLSSILFFPHIF
jgi:hypothetical protein